MGALNKLVGTSKKVGTLRGKISGRALKIVGTIASRIGRKSRYSEKVWIGCKGALLRRLVCHAIVTRRGAASK